MSYDLAVWAGPRPATSADALAEYERRMDALEGSLDGSEEPLAPTASIRAFIDAALAHFPELDEGSGPECPWASSPLAADAMGDFICFSMTFSGAEFARDALADLASSLGLVCFDPQIEQVLPHAGAEPASITAASAYGALLERLDAEDEGRPASSWLSRLLKRSRSGRGSTAGPAAATHRATLESGEQISDPSEDALFMLFEDIEAGRSGYLIVEDLRDSTGQTYAQSSRNSDGTYVVEYRAGGADRHFGTAAADLRAAHSLVAGWTFNQHGWHESATWTPVTL